MNQRLNTLYIEIEKNNEEKFLRNEVVIDQMIDKTIDGTTLQIDLSLEIKNTICSLQDRLIQLEPASLYLTPKKYQHISFNQVVYWGGKYKSGASETWKQIETEFTQKFRILDNVFSSFSIAFNKCIATTGAIIWCAVDENDEMEELRNTIFEKLPFPPEKFKTNHIIHTSITRFTSKLKDPQKVLDLIKKYSETVSMNVTQIILRKEHRYPSLETKEIARIRLK